MSVLFPGRISVSWGHSAWGFSWSSMSANFSKQASAISFRIQAYLALLRNPASSKSMGTIFPTASAHFMSLCHILVILTIFQTFYYYYYYICYGDRWSVVSDVTTVIVLGSHEPHPYKMANLIDKWCVCVPTAPPTGPSPVSPPLLEPPYFLRHNNIEIRPINNPTIASMCSS
jgi:hypothetical protein